MILVRFLKKRFFSFAGVLVISFSLTSAVLLAQVSVEPTSDITSSVQERVRARIVSLEEARLSATVAGLLKQFHVSEGERFKQGQILVSLDCSVADARLVEAKIKLEAAMQNRAAREELAVTRSVGELELELSRISVRQAQASIDIVLAELNQCRILAPFDGVVAKHYFKQAEFVREGEPLLDVFNDTRLQAEFLVPSRWLPNLAVGDHIELDVDEFNRSINGIITRLGISINPVSQSLLVVSQLSGNVDGVRVGMSGTVRFIPK